jgi:predicted RNA binding protein YcfA (HicA-like mRNA interferase family)
MAKSLENLTSGKEFVKYVEHNENTKSIRQCGSHVIAHTEKGMIVIPNHSKDLGTGMKRKLIKTMIIIGLGVLAAIIVFC